MTSARLGHATLRSSERTSRTNSRGGVRFSLGRGAGGALRVAFGSPSAPSAPWRWSIRLVSRFIAIVGNLGRAEGMDRKAGQEGLEPPTYGFGDRCSAS